MKKIEQCFDPDGLDVHKKTTSTGLNFAKTGTISKTDYCSPQEGNNVIYEGYCNGYGQIVNKYMKCPVGEVCSDGVCTSKQFECSPLTQGTSDKNICDYPLMFINENGFNGFIVYGVNSPAHDALASSDISSGINSFIYPPNQINFNQFKLDAEINNPLANNLIVSGHPCYNNLLSIFVWNVMSKRMIICLKTYKDMQLLN